MSQTAHDSTKPTGASNSVPTWIASGILGLAIGAGGMYLGLQFVAPAKPESDITKKGSGPGGRPLPGEPGGGPAAGGPGGGAGGGSGMGGMGGMGGGGGGMGGGGGGMGGGGGKRNLTSLVGKLELLSRADLNLHVELDAEQAKKVAAKLEEINKAEKMTAEEAQAHLEALETLLTAEQKTTLGLVSLPFGRPGGGGGGGGLGAAGRPGGAGAPPPLPGAPGGAPPLGGAGGMGGGSPDENPFTQEANQKRLKDLLSRLAPASAAGESPVAPEKPESEKPETEKPAAPKEG